MEAKILVHRLIRELILESSGIDPALLGSVGGNSAIVLGPQARKLLASSGLTPEEIAIFLVASELPSSITTILRPSFRSFISFMTEAIESDSL